MVRRIVILIGLALLLVPTDAHGALTLLASHREVVTFGSLAIDGDPQGQFRVDRADSDTFDPFDGFIATELDSEGTFISSFARQNSTLSNELFSVTGDFASQGAVGPSGVMAEGFGVTQMLVDFEVDEPTSVVVEGSLAANGNGNASVDLYRGSVPVINRIVFEAALPVHEARVLEPGTHRLVVQTGGYGRQFEGSPASPASGNVTITLRVGATTSTTDPRPARFALAQNRPNPLSRGTAIGFELPSPAPVRLEVFDLTGRRVRVIADRAYEAGAHLETWDRTDAHGARVPAGVYLYRLTAGTARAEKKMAVLGD